MKYMRKVLKSKIVLISLAIIVAIGVVCGTSLPAMAKDKVAVTASTTSADQFTIIKGKVNDVATNKLSFMVQPATGSPIPVNVDINTKYYKMNATPVAVAEMKDKIQERVRSKQANVFGKAQDKNERVLQKNNDNEDEDLEETPDIEEALMANVEAPQGWMNKIKSWFNHNPKFGHNARFEDIEVGDGIVVRALENETLAKQVMIIKAPNIKKAAGTVTAVGPDNFTIKSNTNPAETITFKVNENTHVALKGSLSLKVDQYVLVTYKLEGENKLARTVNVTAAPPNPSVTINNQSQ
jgi:hypothetical protein